VRHYQVIARLATAVARGDTAGARSSNAGSAAAAEALKGLDLSTLDEIHIPEAEWQSVFKLLKDLETGVQCAIAVHLYMLYSVSTTASSSCCTFAVTPHNTAKQNTEPYQQKALPYKYLRTLHCELIF
jgi:hypothetical protein